MKLGDSFGDCGEAAEVLPIGDRGAALDANVWCLFLFQLLLTFHVNDMATAGHHRRFSGGEALEANGTLQSYVDVPECRRLNLDFSLALLEVLL